MKHFINFLDIGSLLIADVFMQLSSLVAVPIALIGLGPDAKHLPKWARWYETYDYDINGDAPWQGPEHANGKQNTYFWRLLWLLRNRTGVFCTEVLGIDRANVVKYNASGDVMTGNIPGHSGFLYAEAVMQNGSIHPCYYFVKQWGKTSKCFRLYAGWKFRQARPVGEWDKFGVAEFVVSPTPFMKFELPKV